MTQAPKEQKKRCVLTSHDVQSIKDLVFVVGGNSESSAQKAIFEILADRMREAHPHPAPAHEPGCYATCPFDDLCANDVEKIQAIEAEAARKAREDVLITFQKKIDQQKEDFATAAIQSRKNGYAAMPKRSVGLNIIEGWVKSLRHTEHEQGGSG